MTGRDGPEPGHTVLVEVRRETGELPYPLADCPGNQPAVAAQEHVVLVLNRPQPHRHRLRRPPGAATPVSVVVEVQEDRCCAVIAA